jgi:DNA recombination protein Rad52
VFTIGLILYHIYRPMILLAIKIVSIFALLQYLFDFQHTNGFVFKFEGKQKQQLQRTSDLVPKDSAILLGSTAGNKRSSNRENNIDDTLGASVIERVQPTSSDYVRDASDYSIMLDHNRIPITIDRMLATKPLQGDCMTRPGPGGRELTYMSGDAVTRNLNMIFGYNQWSLHIIKSEKTVCIEVDNPRASGTKLWHVSYSAHVRITHIPSGCYREDIGCGDVMDRSLVVADQNAVKASITDAMKRTARHFGDKLGNSLYDSEFNIRNAPKSLREALDLYDREKNF